MGEIADDMIDGTTCSLCGQMFVEADESDEAFTHGYPVVCWECWETLSKRERANHERAERRTL